MLENKTGLVFSNTLHTHDHFLLLMACWNETEKFCFRCIRANFNTLIFICLVPDFFSWVEIIFQCFQIRNQIEVLIPISVTVIVIASIYATIKFTMIDLKSGRFGRICNHQPPCSFFAITSNNDSQPTSILTSPVRVPKSPSMSIFEQIELVEQPRSRSDTFPSRVRTVQSAMNRNVNRTAGSLRAKKRISAEINRANEFPNCTYNNIIIARTPNLKPR